jgi:hypothetical protein
MFGIAAFAQLPFATVGAGAAPPPPEAPIGGHFGFDEKKRDAQWAKDQKVEAQRKLKLRETLFNLPTEVREEITSSPEQTINVAITKQVNYDALMLRVKDLQAKVRLRQDENDVAMILEML